MLKELEPKLLELSKSPYGHFVVMKVVALAPKDALPGGCWRSVPLVRGVGMKAVAGGHTRRVWRVCCCRWS